MNPNDALKFAIGCLANDKNLPEAFRQGVAVAGQQYTGQLIEGLTETVKQVEDYPREHCCYESCSFSIHRDDMNQCQACKRYFCNEHFEETCCLECTANGLEVEPPESHDDDPMMRNYR